MNYDRLKIARTAESVWRKAVVTIAPHTLIITAVVKVVKSIKNSNMTLKRFENIIEHMFRLKRDIGWLERAYIDRGNTKSKNYNQDVANEILKKTNKLRSEFDRLHKEILED